MTHYKVLFDHSIRQHALRGEYHINGSFKPYPPKGGWIQHEIDYLEKIADFCRQGTITPYVSQELLAEDRVQKYPSRLYHNVFRGVHFQKAKCAFVRSRYGITLERYRSKEDVIRHCKIYFLDTTRERQERFIEKMHDNPQFSLSDVEERSIRSTHVFQEICHGISETHYPDALHLFTAEMNDIDVFLTLDNKFKNVIDRQQISLSCRTLLPSMLVSEISSRARVYKKR